tara:strand:+ start:1587 stop:2192 length:606 start_codon:yes stop_codon:yes gene_type:complete
MFKFLRINKYDWQFFLPASGLILIFICTDLIRVFDKEFLYYLPKMINQQPHRTLTSSFIHADLNHLMSNLGGIVITRYLLIRLGLKSKYFYIIFIVFYLFSNFFVLWFQDRLLIYLFNINPNYAYLGFSGIIYAFLSFLLLASFFGKSYFLNLKINLERNYEIQKMSKTICFISLIFSFMPKVSLVGHMSGFITGCFLFLI